jgi:DNA polymerase I-like protein with 3'-5' exonuclease and polymerase domains
VSDHPDGIAYLGPKELNSDTILDVLSTIDEPPPVVAIDTETISLKDRTCVGIGVALSREEAIYFRVLPDMSPHVDRLIHIVCNPDILKVYHNVMFDLDVLGMAGEEWGWPEIDTIKVGDTSTLVRVQGIEHQLGVVAANLLGMFIDSYEMVVPKGKNTLDVSWDKIAWKCLHDCLATYGTFDELWGINEPH